MGLDAIGAEEVLAAVIGEDGKWRSGFRGVRVDCPLAVAWDLVVDWGNWRWQTLMLANEVVEGENGKPGCLRRLTYPDWFNCERLVEVDAEQHFLKYDIEENTAFGGLNGYSGCMKFKESEDGKTMLEYWTYELDPLESITAEEFCNFVNMLLGAMMVQLGKGAAQVMTTRNSTRP